MKKFARDKLCCKYYYFSESDTVLPPGHMVIDSVPSDEVLFPIEPKKKALKKTNAVADIPPAKSPPKRSLEEIKEEAQLIANSSP